MKILERLFRPDVAALFARKDVNGLVSALQDKDLKTRWQALLALNDGTISPLAWGKVAAALLQDPQSAPILQELLNARHPEFCGTFSVLSLLWSTAEEHPAEAKPAIAQLTGSIAAVLNDRRDDSGVYSRRDFAAKVLGLGGDPKAVDPLIEALRDPHDGVCRAAMEALGAIGGARAVDALAEVLEQKLKEHRINSSNKSYQSAAKALGLTRDGRAAEVLATAMVDADDWETNDIRKAIESMGEGVKAMSDSAIDSALSRLRTGSARARCASAFVLGRAGNPRAVPALVAALGDGTSYTQFGQYKQGVCEYARSALIAIGPPARDALVAAVESGAPGAKLARRALASMPEAEPGKATDATTV